MGAWSQLGGPWSLLEGPQSQLGGLRTQLGGPWSQLGGPWSQLGGQLRGRGGDGEREKNGAFIVCGGTIGHRPLRGRCPKTIGAEGILTKGDHVYPFPHTKSHSDQKKGS